MKARVSQPNNPAAPAQPETRWHQVPLLWMCLALFVLMMMGCVHLIVISLQFDDAYGVSEQQASNGAFFRMPLTKESTVEASAEQELAPLTSAQPSGAPSSREVTERVNASDSN